jgi:2-phospho-L-lactate guanylyltransferase
MGLDVPVPAWTVVLPVKGLGEAKSRLAVDGSGVARAFLVDVLAAAAGCSQVAEVVVATHDPAVGALARNAGARVFDDSGHPGINAAAAQAASRARGPVAVVVSDLPCLTSDDLSAVLVAAADHERAFVRDADGTGTTMLLAVDPNRLRPAFGPGSAAAHEATGAVDLAATHAWPRARRDVDTAEALADAVALGVGPATRSVLALP